MFYDKNNLFIGLLLGLALPIISLALLQVFSETWDASHITPRLILSEAIRPRTLRLVALCFNVFLMRWFQRRRYDESMRGVFIAIGIFAIAWMYFYGAEVFS
jgi:hypothetical protein